MNTPPSLEILSLEEIKRDAILNRLDVRSALAQYAAAEAGLQLEIARQYPDINIGPGYTYEERRSYFTVGLSAAVPLFDRNQGPIGEAEARRKEAAAAFLETQAQVIAKSERALAVYTAALQELAEAQHLETLQGSQRQAVRASVRLGEQDRIDLDAVEIQGTFAAHARLEALGHAQSALGDLEDAVQRPLAVGEELPIDPESPALNKPTGVSKE
jgi:outer membrane protein TolC